MNVLRTRCGISNSRSFVKVSRHLQGGRWTLPCRLVHDIDAAAMLLMSGNKQTRKQAHGIILRLAEPIIPHHRACSPSTHHPITYSDNVQDYKGFYILWPGGCQHLERLLGQLPSQTGPGRSRRTRYRCFAAVCCPFLSSRHRAYSRQGIPMPIALDQPSQIPFPATLASAMPVCIDLPKLACWCATLCCAHRPPKPGQRRPTIAEPGRSYPAGHLARPFPPSLSSSRSPRTIHPPN
jgi:hypothetical protein